MEDFIYIALAILWVVYGIYKKNEKAKQSLLKKQQLDQQILDEPEEEEESYSGNSILDTLLKGMDAEEVTRKQAPVYVAPATSPKSIDTIFDRIDQVPAPNFNDKSASKQTKPKPIKKSNSYHQHNPVISAQAFDLRQAVIHSIILNRPTY